MSNSTSNSYSHYQALGDNDGATAAAVDIVTKACSGGCDTNRTAVLDWATDGDNLKTLRDKIIECASE